MNLLFTLFFSSCRYFTALSKGECLPVKERLEMNIAGQTTDTGLTPGLLKVLHKQVFFSSSQMYIDPATCRFMPHIVSIMVILSSISPLLSVIPARLAPFQLSQRQKCSRRELKNKWKGVCLPPEQLETLLSLGSFGSVVDWMSFFALGCSTLGGVRHHLKYFFWYSAKWMHKRSRDPQAKHVLFRSKSSRWERPPIEWLKNTPFSLP